MTETEYPGADSGSGYQAKGLPAYLVLDTSSSMKPFETLLNSTLLDIYDVLYGRPQVKEFVHLSVISFNTTPEVVTPMADIEQLESLPSVYCEGATNLSPLFQLLRTRITEDVRKLAADGIRVLRPVVFVLTDGAPTDQPQGTWQADLDRLRDPAWKLHPNVITYGFGDARESVLTKMATVACYLAEDGAQTNAEALTTALTTLLNSLVASAAAQQLQVPESVKGYRSIDLPYVG